MESLFAGFTAVLDSGVGGLTVLKDLRAKYGECDFLYLADGAYCSYGTKSASALSNRLQTLLTWFESNGVRSAVLACNTASVFIGNLRRRFDLPVYGVIEPTCRLAAQTTVNKRVALLATNLTVKSGVYDGFLAKMRIETVSFACSALVPFAENNAFNSAACDNALHNALKNLPQANADTVILGCTHFPLLQDKISAYAGNAHIVQCVTDFSPSVFETPAANDRVERRRGKTIFLTTGNAPQINKTASVFCPEANFAHVDI